MKPTSESVLKRSVRFGVCGGLAAFTLAIGGGAGAFALADRAVTEDAHVASSADPVSPGHAGDLVSAQSASDRPIELARVTPRFTPPEPDRPPAVTAALTATATPALVQEPPVAASASAAPMEPAAVAAAAPTVAPEPRVEASRETLYGTIAAAFPEAPDKAYRVVMCESGGYAATNTGNGYYGLWQFDLPTWRSVGGTGLPSDASAAEQVMRARMLYDARGWSPWGCG